MSRSEAESTKDEEPKGLAVLFCHVDVPPEELNRLLTESQQNDKKGDKDKETMAWALIRTPEDSLPDGPTAAPVESFKTGFADWSLEDIGHHALKLFEGKERRGGFCGPGVWGVMNKYSVESHSVRVFFWANYLVQEHKIMDEEDHPSVLRYARVRYKDSLEVVGQCAIHPWVWIDNVKFSDYDDECVIKSEYWYRYKTPAAKPPDKKRARTESEE